ncbi:major facilitator superfamily transporter [Colletotrichum lupini]|uniref:Major facilitator superfamily transporter n=1 Tax=Colletotrichum lupini TaxID=145971 RepID=A0A9Q8SI86_9PEZI|nr:major facilitator superfamily transporter [Colletotrichum lupini]UQC77455.1 major facilitator superfamily transporter [Colletotrichum lupini]
MLEHGYHIIVPMLFTLAGCVVMITTLNVGARYFSMILLVTGPFLGLNVRSWDFFLSRRISIIDWNSCKFLGRQLSYLDHERKEPLSL